MHVHVTCDSKTQDINVRAHKNDQNGSVHTIHPHVHKPRKSPTLRNRVLFGPADPPTTAVGDCATDPHRPSPVCTSTACSDASDMVVLLAMDTLSCVLASLRRVVAVAIPVVVQQPSIVCSIATAAAIVTGACKFPCCTRCRLAGLSLLLLLMCCTGGLTALPSTAGGAPGVGSCCE